MTATAPRTPTYPVVQHDHIPNQLKEHPQWVAWRWGLREGKYTKLPINPRTGGKAMTNKPSTWGTIDEAQRHAAQYNIGIGYVFHQDDPFAGVDFDDCLDPETGELAPITLERIRSLDSYTEVSPSGKGVKVILLGKLPSHYRRNDAQRIEMYDDRRLFTLTGNLFPGAPTTIEPRQAELDRLHTEVFAHKLQKPKPTIIADPGGSLFSDEEVIEKALGSKNGTRFAQLFFQGDTTSNGGNQSGADLALCNLLRFWTRGDTAQMDRLFRRSALMRDKWDKAARSGETYGEGTIREALPGDIYEPTRSTPQIIMESSQPLTAFTSHLEDAGSGGECAEAYQRIRELEMELVGKQARIDQLESEVQHLKRIDSLQAQLLKNSKMDDGSKITLMALVPEIAGIRSGAGARTDESRDRRVAGNAVVINRTAVAEKIGCSPGTAGRRMTKLADAGLFRKHYRPRMIREPETGKLMQRD